MEYLWNKRFATLHNRTREWPYLRTVKVTANIILPLIAILINCLCSCVVGSSDNGDNRADYESQLLQAGTEAPDFTINDSTTLRSLRGSVVALQFWASWCSDCQSVTSRVVSLYNQYKDKGVTFVGVSFDTDGATWQNYISQNGMNWLQCSELKKWKQDTTIDVPYNVQWIPTFYIIDKEGKVLSATTSVDTFGEALNNATK